MGRYRHVTTMINSADVRSRSHLCSIPSLLEFARISTELYWAVPFHGTLPLDNQCRMLQKSPFLHSEFWMSRNGWFLFAMHGTRRFCWLHYERISWDQEFYPISGLTIRQSGTQITESYKPRLKLTNRGYSNWINFDHLRLRWNTSWLCFLQVGFFGAW